MREIPLSLCERDFVSKCIAQKQRLDGRQAYDYRKIKINFGLDRGSCLVELGETRCLAQVSSEVTTPKPTRPTDGILFTNVELSPMASPSFEPGRLSGFGVELNRLLERCLKESRCIDTESLCIVAGEKVWTIRVDVHVLNHEGNLLDCVSVAAITALAHFRRPDVTVSGDEITVHPVEEKNPVALSVLHMPLTVTFAFFDQGRFVLVDPSLREELVMDGQMVIGMNKHRVICTLQMTGDMLLLKDQVLRCSNIAVVKVTEMTELIQAALKTDAANRSEGKAVGFAVSHDPVKITSHTREEEPVDLDGVKEKAVDVVQEGEELTKHDGLKFDPVAIKVVKKKSREGIGEGGPTTWGLDEDQEGELMQETAMLHRNTITTTTRLQDVAMSDDSEEEPVILSSQDLYVKRSELKDDTKTKTPEDTKTKSQASTGPPTKKVDTGPPTKKGTPGSGKKKKKKSKS